MQGGPGTIYDQAGRGVGEQPLNRGEWELYIGKVRHPWNKIDLSYEPGEHGEWVGRIRIAVPLFQAPGCDQFLGLLHQRPQIVLKSSRPSELTKGSKWELDFGECGPLKYELLPKTVGGEALSGLEWASDFPVLQAITFGVGRVPLPKVEQGDDFRDP